MSFQSWGNYPRVSQRVSTQQWRTDRLPYDRPLIPHGQGRSYGDVALNDGGTIISTKHLNHLIAFDADRGLLTCESGVTIAQILEVIVRSGWFIPVTPGTKFVSVGGAIANDVHGKNHHRVGTFGCHVTQFELMRSTGERILCSPEQNQKLFRATIGGLGLTGLITWAEIQLIKITTPYLDVETIKTHNLDELLLLSDESDKTHDYTVTWIDTSAHGTKLGRGLFMRANFSHAHADVARGNDVPQPLFTMPFYAPNWLLSTPLMKAWNILYYHKQQTKHKTQQSHYNPFFYPLDSIQYWNRLYGRRGFQSFQCVIPREHASKAMSEFIDTLHEARLSSPLTIAKLFGNVSSPGMLSFPRPGFNILFDIPNVGSKSTQLLRRFDAIALAYSGRINPAKDAHMSAHVFQTMYPQWREFGSFIDPAFSSSFWRRVTRES